MKSLKGKRETCCRAPVVGSTAAAAWHELQRVLILLTVWMAGAEMMVTRRSSFFDKEHFDEDSFTEEAMAAVATPSAGWHGDDDSDDVDTDSDTFAVRKLFARSCGGRRRRKRRRHLKQQQQQQKQKQVKR